jgi:PIN domain nuclease of toxin-antitoxin system
MIILDTHVWLWFLHDPSRLSDKAQEAIAVAESEQGLYVSAISVWEIAVKVSLGKLALPLMIHEWYEMACQYRGVVIEPMGALDAIASTQLPGTFHKDPSDRIIIAMARRYDVPLITRDQKILDYPHVETIW